jgi:hypothetical protein
MLDSITSEVWAFMMLGLVVTAACYAWAADAILGRFGFGVILTTFIAEGGGYGGLMATDWAIKHQKLPYDYSTPTVYVGGAFISVTVLLLVLCLLKRFVYR